jgi:hypothetical protein
MGFVTDRNVTGVDFPRWRAESANWRVPQHDVPTLRRPGGGGIGRAADLPYQIDSWRAVVPRRHFELTMMR